MVWMDGRTDGRTDVGMYVCMYVERERECVCVGDNVCVCNIICMDIKSTDVRLCACDYVIL